jgi:hypothetical protein
MSFPTLIAGREEEMSTIVAVLWRAREEPAARRQRHPEQRTIW